MPTFIILNRFILLFDEHLKEYGKFISINFVSFISIYSNLIYVVILLEQTKKKFDECEGNI